MEIDLSVFCVMLMKARHSHESFRLLVQICLRIYDWHTVCMILNTYTVNASLICSVPSYHLCQPLKYVQLLFPNAAVVDTKLSQEQKLTFLKQVPQLAAMGVFRLLLFRNILVNIKELLTATLSVFSIAIGEK